MAATDENDIIDLEVFGQILDMDEEDDNEFSRSIVYNYFDQAKTTFKEMDDALKTEDLPELSRKGHFLKGSSAALGLKNLKNICEKIQHLGSNKDELGITDISQEEALSRIKSSLKAVKEEYERAETYLRELYEEDDMVEPEPEEEADEPDEDSQKLEKDNHKDESTSDRGQDPKNSQDHDINPIPISTPTEVPPSAS